MIKYFSENKAFMISGRSCIYCMYVNESGYLQQLDYGKKIEESDIAFLIKTHGKSLEPCAHDINADMSTDRMPTEIGSFGKGDFHSATVIVRRSEGDAMSAFKYVSHRITEDAIKLNRLPCVRKADETLIITVKDEYSETEIDLRYSILNDSDVLVRNLIVRNNGTTDIDIKKAFSFCMQLPNNNKQYSALRLAGAWANEMNPVVTPLAEGTLRIESTRGYSSHEMNPFMAILQDSCDECSGECYGFNLLYSGNFAITAETHHNKTVRVQGGINDYMFDWHLSVGEEFVTPQSALCYSNAGLGGMSRAYHDFFQECIINPTYVYKSRPILLNNWEATYFDFTDEKLYPIIDEAGKLGMDMFVLDDGWFGKRNNDKSSLGDWYVNDKKLNGGLNSIIARCKKNNLKFGLWFEPEMVSEDSDLYRAHPDWAIAMKSITPSRARNQLILDLSKKEVVDYVFGAISKVLQENEIAYVKWDRNRDMTEFYSNSLLPDRQGEFAHRYVLGFYDLAQRLTTAFPKVLFEGCSGGGGRFDGGALYYFPQIWTSDNTDGLERAKIQWGASICYPLSAMSCHVSVCPNHQTQRTVPLETRGAIASLGILGYELDIAKLTEEEKDKIKEQISRYKQINNMILQGDLYRLSDPFISDYFCVLCVSHDKTKAYIVGERFHSSVSIQNPILKLVGLDENTNYRIEELDIIASGKALMNVGVPYPWLHECESWIWHVYEYTAKWRN